MVINEPSKQFFFVRHGVTAANLQKRWCGGDWDIDLHPDGEVQAQRLAPRIFEIACEFDHIFHSPMLRAQRTAQLINDKVSKPMKAVEDLREWRIGVLERAPWTDPLLSKPVCDWPTPEGGESVTVFRARIQSALLHCLAETERPLIVAHGAVGRILLDLLQVPDQHIPNCALFKFSSSSESGRVVWTVTES